MKPALPKTSTSHQLKRPTFAAPIAKTCEKKAREKRKPRKNDLSLVKKARDLRDRWSEAVNDGVTQPIAIGKYDVRRSDALHRHT